MKSNLSSAAEFRSATDGEESPSGPFLQSLPPPSPITCEMELLNSPSRIVILAVLPFRTRTKPAPIATVLTVSRLKMEIND